MRIFVAVVCLAALGCAPNPQAPVKIMALLYNNANKLGPRETQLTTLTSVTGLKGSIINLVGGGALAIDPTDPLQADLGGKSDTQVFDAFVRARGTEVHANLIDKSGVLWPGDFHSWAMVTTYWNFEQAFEYFTRAYDGEMIDPLTGAEVLYWGDYKDYTIADPALQALTDNVFYFPPTRQFLVAPFKNFQKVPVSMNLGIIGHELSHRVFTQKAYGNEPLPTVLNLQGAPVNIIRALDEGIADFHGYGVTCIAAGGPGCSTKFIEASYDASISSKRDFADPANGCMSVELRSALTLPSGTFLAQGQQYKLGTLFAAALYQASEPFGDREVLQKALIKAYTDDRPQFPGLRQVFEAELSSPQNITLERVADVLINHMPAGTALQRNLCTQLVDRLDLDRTRVPHCPTTALNGDKCMDLGPP